jgi:hypothetical protein
MTGRFNKMGNECFDVVGTFQKIIVKVARFLQILQNPKIKMKKSSPNSFVCLAATYF